MEVREHEGRAPTRGRRRLIVAIGVTALAAVVALVAVLTSPGDDDPATEPVAEQTLTSAPRPEPSLGASESPAPPAIDPDEELVAADELPPSLPPVPLGEPAETDDGVTAEVVDLGAVQGVGQGRGSVSGPALRLTVRLTNDTSEEVDLDAVVVAMSYGGDRVPASPLDDPSQEPFTGTLEPGDSAEAVYVFSVPDGARDVVTVSLSHRADAPFLVFSGSAP